MISQPITILRRWRTERDMSCRAVARQSGIPLLTLQRLDNGSHRRRPYEDTLDRLSEFTGIPRALLDREYVEPYEERTGLAPRTKAENGN